MVLLAMCIIREFLGGGTFGGGVLGAVTRPAAVGIQIFPADYGIGMLTLPVGGFLVLGCSDRCHAVGSGSVPRRIRRRANNG